MKTNFAIELSQAQLAEIAEELNCGMRVFYQLSSGEIKILIDKDQGFDLMDEDLESWAEIEANGPDHFEIEKMDTRHSFDIMEEFAEKIPDSKFKTRLYQALNKPKPFRNFKHEIDNNWDYRQDWFDFKKEKLISYVEEQIKNYNLIQSEQDEPEDEL